MVMHRNTEQEWQFSAPGLAAAREWLAAQPREFSERHFVRRPTLELRDTYYDSPDWMIYRAGFALRLRRSRCGPDDAESSEVTLKALAPARDGLARREEISQSVTATDISTVLRAGEGIGEHIRALIGARALDELFRARTRRERECLLEADSELPLAEIDLDETTLEARGNVCELQRVEIECLHAEPAALDGVVENLRSAANLVPVPGSKFRAGLELAGLQPSEPLAGARGIHAAQPFEHSLMAILRRFFAALLTNEPRVRLGSPVAVHEMRVAARHLDAILRATRDTTPEWARQAHGAVRSLVKRLGAVRDCDVQLAHLDATMAAQEADREALRPLRERIAGERTRAHGQLLRELDSPPGRAFQERWLAELGAEPASASAADSAPRAGAVARELIRAQARKLRKRAGKLGRESGPDDYHRVRMTAKRLRYVLAAFESLYGPAGREFTRALAKLQDVLGEFHDAVVRDQRYAELVNRALLPPATGFVIGRIVERDSAAFARCRERFPKAYRRVRGRRWRALLESMERQAECAS
jgi:triphosphatase